MATRLWATDILLQGKMWRAKCGCPWSRYLTGESQQKTDANASVFSVLVLTSVLRQKRSAHPFGHREQESTGWQNRVFDFIHVGFERLQTRVAGLEVERVAVTNDADLEFF